MNRRRGIDEGQQEREKEGGRHNAGQRRSSWILGSPLEGSLHHAARDAPVWRMRDRSATQQGGLSGLPGPGAREQAVKAEEEVKKGW